MRRRLVAVLVLAVAALAAGVAAYLRHPHAAPVGTVAPPQAKAQVGQPAPEFRAATTAGPFDLASVDKPVFLEVFATWCPHCQRETAIINALYRRYHDRIAFVAVSGSDTGMDGTSPASQLDVLDFRQRFHVEYPVAYDATVSTDAARSVATLYLQGGFPTVALIDRAKKVVYADSGEIPAGELEAQLRKLL